MTAQTSIPGVGSTAHNATLEADARGAVTLCILALRSWGEYHGGLTPTIAGVVERYLEHNDPDIGVTRTADKLRALLARYDSPPAWIPESLVTLLRSVPSTVRNERQVTP